jgi:hypothetical protein
MHLLESKSISDLDLRARLQKVSFSDILERTELVGFPLFPP